MMEEMRGRSSVNDTGQGSKIKYCLSLQFQTSHIDKMLGKED